MADGQYIQISELIGIPTLTTSFTGEHSDHSGPYSLLDSAGLSVGTFTSAGAVDVPPHDEYDGFYTCTYFDDYYNRIYFFPQSVDFGAVTSEVTQIVRVWNAYLTTVTLNSITPQNDQGLSIDGPVPPANFLALGLYSYTFTATTDGPPTIDARYHFDFNTPDDYSLPVTGVRAVLWPFLPNWRDPYQITYSFLTDIIVSREGKEQRRSLRQEPRRDIEFTVTVTNDKLRRLNRIMASQHNIPFVVPEVPTRVELAAPYTAGDLTIQTDVLPRWAVPGIALVLLIDESRQEVAIIDSVNSDNEIVIQSALSHDWPVGTRVALAWSAVLDATLDVPRRTNTTAEMAVRFAVTPGVNVPVPDGDPEVVFNGREVLLMKPNWAGGLTVNESQDYEIVDYQFGRVAYFRPVDFSTRIWRATFVGKDNDEIDRLSTFFQRQQGQRGEFYMPTWEPDIVLKTTAPGGTNSLRIAGTDLYEAYHEDTVYRAVFIRFNDGTYLMNTVDEITEVDDADGNDSVIVCDENWPSDLNPADILMICWMPVWRFASDQTTVEWLTDSVAQVQLVMRSLEALPPEAVP